MFSFQETLEQSDEVDRNSFFVEKFELQQCIKHDNEPFVSVCLFPTCHQNKLCWKCMDSHQFHPGLQQDQMSLIQFFNKIQTLIQKQLPIIKSITQQSEINQKFQQNMLENVAKLKDIVLTQFNNLEQRISLLLQEVLDQETIELVSECSTLQNLQMDDILKDQTFALMLEMYHYEGKFNDRLRNIKSREEHLEQSLTEVITKIESCLSPFLLIQNDLEVLQSKFHINQQSSQEKAKKRQKQSDFTNFQLNGTLLGNDNVCKSCIQLHDGDFATASRDKTIKIWCSQNQQCKQVIRDHTNWVQDLINLPELNFCSCSDDKKLKIFGKQKQKAPPKKISLLTAQLSKPKQSIDSIQSDIAEDDWVCLITLVGHDSYVMRVIYNPWSNNLVSCSTDGTLRVWGFTLPVPEMCKILISNSIAINKEKYYSNSKLEGHQNCVYSLAQSQDEQNSEYIVSGDEGGQIVKWSVREKKIITQQLEAHVGCVNCLVIQKDQTIISGGDDKTILVWDSNLQIILNSITLERCEIECFVLLDNKMLLCGDEQGYIVLVQLESQEIQLQISAHKDRIFRINYYSDRKLICTASADHIAKIWNVI